MRLNWLKTFAPDEITEILEQINPDMAEIHRIVGTELFTRLLDEFQKQTVYFSSSCIDSLAREYVRRNPDASVRDLQKTLQRSDSFIYAIRNVADTNQLGMFDNLSD